VSYKTELNKAIGSILKEDKLELYSAIGQVLKGLKDDLESQVVLSDEQRLSFSKSTLEQFDDTLDLISELSLSVGGFEDKVNTLSLELGENIESQIQTINETIVAETKLLSDEFFNNSVSHTANSDRIDAVQASLKDHLQGLSDLHSITVSDQQDVLNAIETVNVYTRTVASQLEELLKELSLTVTKDELVESFKGVLQQQIAFKEALSELSDVVADNEGKTVERQELLQEDLSKANTRLDDTVSKSEMEEQVELLSVQQDAISEDLVKFGETIGEAISESEDQSTQQHESIEESLAKANTRIDDTATKGELDSVKSAVAEVADNHDELCSALDDFQKQVNENSNESDLAVHIKLEDVKKDVADSRKAITLAITEDVADFIDEKVADSKSELAEESEGLINELSKELKGERGETGYLKRAKAWVEGDEFVQLSVVRYEGGLWQCKCDTYEEPCFDCEDWILLANGIQQVSTKVLNDITKLELVIRTSDGEDRTHVIDYPVPCFKDTFNPKVKYNFYDLLFGQRGKRGLRGEKGEVGARGEIGPMTPINKILEALREFENRSARKDDGAPIRTWRSRWVLSQSYEVGDVINFSSALWIAIADEPEALIPPSALGNKVWAMMLDTTGSVGVVKIADDNVIVDPPIASATNQHDLNNIFADRLGVLEALIVQLTPSGYGGGRQVAPIVTFDLVTAYTTLPFDTLDPLANRGVVFDTANDNFVFTHGGIWQLMITFNLVGHSSSGGGRTTRIRVLNEVTATPSHGTIIGIGSNQGDTFFSIACLIEVPQASVDDGDSYRVELGESSADIDGGTLVSATIQTTHVSELGALL
jgi:hypothetical protein